MKRFQGSLQKFLYFIPLIAISTVNLWSGLQRNTDLLTTVLPVICMCFVAFLEELIFRGFLFKAMKVTTALAMTVAALGYGFWLLKAIPAPDTAQPRK